MEIADLWPCQAVPMGEQIPFTCIISSTVALYILWLSLGQRLNSFDDMVNSGHTFSCAATLYEINL